jgi:effector-binding domain-containing protein
MSRTTLATLSLTFAASMALAAAPQAPKAPAAPAPPSAPATPAAPAPPAAPTPLPVVVKTVDAIHALVLPMKGSYAQHGEAFGRLFGQAGPQGTTPLGLPFGRYFNSMGTVAEADLLWEIGFPVSADFKASAPFEIKDIAGGLTATLVYQGPSDSLGDVGSRFGQWAAANGYRSTGAMMMVFNGQMDPQTMNVELRMPVEKAK